MTHELKDLISDVKEQLVYLRELGVESISAELPEVEINERTVATAPKVSKATPPLEIPKPKIEKTEPRKATAGARLAKLPSLNNRPVEPKSKKGELPSVDTLLASGMVAPSDERLSGDVEGLPESSETMEQIWNDIGNCIRCPLHQGRTQIVQTVGNYNADLMFIGEAPGADEDAKGEPFVGRAGQLLNKIIEAIGMTRDEVCIGNINRCRPPGNRQPTLPEAHTCKPFLLREIAVIRPKVIVVLGNTALHNLLDTKVGITRMRGQFHEYYGVKVMPTFHPAYLLRDPSKKREVWDDMKKVRDYLNSVTKP